jgi:hypothetical protein
VGWRDRDDRGGEARRIEDRTVSNDGPIRETALDVLAWLGWASA